MSWAIAFMVVAIVAITTLGRISRERYRAMARINDDAALRGDAAASQDEIHRLKDRIAVLERVITDNHGSTDLSRQIEELRER